jgi:hypothetical protein
MGFQFCPKPGQQVSSNVKKVSQRKKSYHEIPTSLVKKPQEGGGHQRMGSLSRKQQPIVSQSTCFQKKQLKTTISQLSKQAGHHHTQGSIDNKSGGKFYYYQITSSSNGDSKPILTPNTDEE